MDPARHSPGKLVLLALLAGLAFQALLGTAYIAASLDPVGESIGLPVALVVLDEGARGRELAEALRAADSPVAWVEVGSREEAFALLVEKRAYGALVVPRNFTVNVESYATRTPTGATLEVMTNAGASTSGNVVASRVIDAAIDGANARIRDAIVDNLDATSGVLGASAITQAQARFLAQPIRVTESAVNAVPHNGGNGLAPTYLAMACWMGGYIGSAALERFRPFTKLRAGRRALLVAGASLAQGVIVTALAMLVGLTVRDPVALALFLAVATWMTYCVVSLLTDLMGLAGLLPAFAILSLGLPAGGAIWPAQMLPPFFRALHGWSPFTWLVEGLRTLLYAPGATDLAGHTVALFALATAAVILSLMLAAARDRRSEASSEAEEADLA